MAKYKFKTAPHMGRKIVLDTETTGLSPQYGDKLVEIAMVELVDGKLTGNEFHSYVNPERDVPFEAVNVHGLTEAFLRDKPRFIDIAGEIASFLGPEPTEVWAHNASFDARFVNAELDWIDAQKIDTFECSLRLARAVLGKGKRDLATLSSMAGLTFGGRGAHSALADTKMLGNVLVELLWPTEAKIASDPSKAPMKTTAAKKKDSSAPSASPAKSVPIMLPEGFAALTDADDVRICRYDDADVDHLITSRGKRWTQDEEQRLVDHFLKEGRDVIELVASHGRTPAALFLKLEALGVVAQGHPYTRPNR